MRRTARSITPQVEADHRIANTLQQLAAVLRQERQRVTDAESAKAALDDVVARLGAAAQLHKQFCRAPCYDRVCLETFLEDLCTTLATSLDVDFVHEIGDVHVSVATGGHIGTILNEFAMNALKHGRHDGKRVVVTIGAERQGDGGLVITLRDNGCGLPPASLAGPGEGLGMLIMTSTAEKMRGTIQRTEGDGAGLEIHLPYH